MPTEETSLVEMLTRANLHLVGLSELITELSNYIADQKPNISNILSESEMAKYLGITKKALEHRRARGQFPNAACAKLGRSWFYNVAIYEAWKDAAWAKAASHASAASPPCEPSRAPKRRKATPRHEVYRLV